MNKKLNIITTLVSGTLLIASLIIPQTSFGQQSASVDVNRVAFLSFQHIPEPFALSAQTGYTTNLFSNSNNLDTSIKSANLITIKDVRNSGGFDLTANAEDFTGSSGTVGASNLRIITSSQVDNPPASDFTNNGILYGTGFVGNHRSATTPVAVEQNYNFTDPTNFTSFNNTLNNPVTLINGCLASSDGRQGEMSLGAAFDLQLPDYTIPGQYDSKVTFTLTDHSDNC